MKVDYEKGSISFDVYDFLRYYTPKEKLMELAEDLSITNSVIERVTHQILDATTDQGSCAEYAYTAQSTPTTGLDWAWREIAKSSGDVAKREIERLEKALEVKDETIADLRERMEEQRNTYSRCHG